MGGERKLLIRSNDAPVVPLLLKHQHSIPAIVVVVVMMMVVIGSRGDNITCVMQQRCKARGI